jgi:hypothetical protein
VKKVRQPAWVKKYGLLKWDYIRNNGGIDAGVSKNYPALMDFIGECSYCSFYRKLVVNVLCHGCKLGEIVDFCCDGLYKKWCLSKTKKTRIKYANLIYEYIKKHG